VLADSSKWLFRKKLVPTGKYYLEETSSEYANANPLADYITTPLDILQGNPLKLL
jgi:hypothetical protein